MKNRPYVYRLKLTDFELCVMVKVLNDRRLRMKANGEDLPTFRISSSNVWMLWKHKIEYRY